MFNVTDLFELINKGKIKTKGAYEVLPFTKLGWHKDHSAQVIPMAVVSHLIGYVDYEEFIRFHENKFDFMLRTKVPRSSRLVLVVDNEEISVQNICRYYPSLNGGKLVKIMPPLEGSDEERRIGIDTDWNVKVCNNINDFNWDIDYNYYFQEAKKLIDAVSNSQCT